MSVMDTRTINARVTPENHAWLAGQADKNGVSFARALDALLQSCREAGFTLSIQPVITTFEVPR